MEPLFRYPWLIMGPLLLVNIVVAHPRAKHLIANHVITEGEWRRFAKAVTGTVLGYSLAVTALQIASGFTDFFCLLELGPARSVASAAFWAFHSLVVIALLGWIWIGGGADTVARVGPAFSRWATPGVPFRRSSVRVVVTLLLLASNGGIALQIALGPAPSPERLAECAS